MRRRASSPLFLSSEIAAARAAVRSMSASGCSDVGTRSLTSASRRNTSRPRARRRESRGGSGVESLSCPRCGGARGGRRGKQGRRKRRGKRSGPMFPRRSTRRRRRRGRRTRGGTRRRRGRSKRRRGRAMRVEPKTFHFFGIRFLFWLLLYSLSLSRARAFRLRPHGLMHALSRRLPAANRE